MKKGRRSSSSRRLTPLRTTHTQQELWAYKKDKAGLFFVTH
jgi:hypothetical protein